MLSEMRARVVVATITVGGTLRDAGSLRTPADTELVGKILSYGLALTPPAGCRYDGACAGEDGSKEGTPAVGLERGLPGAQSLPQEVTSMCTPHTPQ